MLIFSEKCLQPVDLKGFLTKTSLAVIKTNYIVSAFIQVLIVDLGPHLWLVSPYFALLKA